MGRSGKSIIVILATLAVASAAWGTNHSPPPDPGKPSNSAAANAVAEAVAVGTGIGEAHAEGGKATATGGAGGQGGHADASAAGGTGGNASAVQTQTAAGGAGGTGGTASNLGNAQNLSVNYRDRLQAPSINVPAVYASAVCAYGWSAGLSVPGAGVSGGKSKIDSDCNRREAARVLTPLNPQLALKVMCADPMVAAVVTLGDCEYVIPVVAMPVPITPVDPAIYATKDELQKAFKKSLSK